MIWAAREAKEEPEAGTIAALRVWHAPQPAPAAPAQASDLWHVTTCQRELRIATVGAAEAAHAAIPTVFTLHRGLAAYELLLRIAAGLESAIPGETNVLGQLRRSWESHRTRCVRPPPALTAVAAALFADAATVRSRHLQGIGGTSYGTLARMLLRPRPGARVLVAGNGALSKAVLPSFGAFEVALYARRPAGAMPQIAHFFGPGEEPAAVAWAEAICICLPERTERDAVWAEALRTRLAPALHLGLQRTLSAPWAQVPGLHTLDDLFDLQRSRSQLRSVRLERAARCCRDLALARFGRPSGTALQRA